MSDEVLIILFYLQKKKNRIFLKLVYYWNLEMSILQIIDINKNKILNKR